MNGRRTTHLILGTILALAACNSDVPASDDAGAAPPPPPPPALDDAGTPPSDPPSGDPADAAAPPGDAAASPPTSDAAPPPSGDDGPTGSGMPCVLGFDFGGDGFGCPEGEICVDDPSDPCDGSGREGCPGICDAAPSGGTGSGERDAGAGDDPFPGGGGGGGFARAECYPGIDFLPCPDGATCVDDPTDDCTPGSALPCPGICTP